MSLASRITGRRASRLMGISGQTRVHMRYRAGTCLLKLAQVKAFDKALSTQFENIAVLVMDPNEDVRHKFLLKLGEVLPGQRLLPRWNMLPAFAALDPEAEDIALVHSLLRRCALIELR